MTMRDKIAKNLYLRRSNNCLVPFEHQGETLRAECYADTDIALDALMDPFAGMSGWIIQAGIDATPVPPSGSVCDTFRAMIRAVKDGK